MSLDTSQNRPWADLQRQAETAALQLGLSFAAAGRFAAGVARHLAAHREAADILALLEQPEEIARLSQDVDSAIETSFVSGRPVSLGGTSQSVRASFFEGLPCAVGILERAEGTLVLVSPKEPSLFARQDSVDVPETLWQALKRAAQMSGKAPLQGADLMGL